jgi:hypothetical protein
MSIMCDCAVCACVCMNAFPEHTTQCVCMRALVCILACMCTQTPPRPHPDPTQTSHRSERASPLNKEQIMVGHRYDPHTDRHDHSVHSAYTHTHAHEVWVGSGSGLGGGLGRVWVESGCGLCEVWVQSG